MVIETEKLTKLYSKKVGCKDISLSVREGAIFAFLGPNGAGKSTFVKILTGLLFPTSGRAVVLGKPAGHVETRKKIGYLPENFKFQEWMTGVDLLSFHASLYKIDKKAVPARLDDVLGLVKLKGQEKYKIGSYSKGMQQRIGIASALLPDPELLFLDEPTSALDPIGRKEVREIMVDLKDRGKTIFLNSHLLSEVEMVCDSAAIIHKGTLLRCGSMEDILESKITLDIHAENLDHEILNRLRRFDPHAIYKNNRIQMNIYRKEEIHDIASLIIENGGKLYELTPRKESLEDIFIGLIEGGKNS